jgi:hypothetical protein
MSERPTALAGRRSVQDTPPGYRDSAVEQVSERFVPRVVVVELVVELQQVVVADRSAAFGLFQFRWETPSVHLYAGGDKKIDCARLGGFEHRHLAGRARERIIASVVIDANTDPDVIGRELNITAGFATRSNGSHDWNSSSFVAALVRASIGPSTF